MTKEYGTRVFTDKYGFFLNTHKSVFIRVHPCPKKLSKKSSLYFPKRLRHNHCPAHELPLFKGLNRRVDIIERVLHGPQIDLAGGVEFH